MRTDFGIVVIGGGIVGACTAALAAGSPVFSNMRIALIEAQPPTMPPPEQGVDLRVSAFRSEEHTSELQSRENLVCRLLLEKKKNKKTEKHYNVKTQRQ